MSRRRTFALALALPLVAVGCNTDDVASSLPSPEATGGAAGAADRSAAGSGGTSSAAIDPAASLDAGTSESTLDADVPGEPSPNPDAGASSDAGGSTYAPDWCARAGAEANDRTDTFFLVAVAYADAQSTDCATAGLTDSLDLSQTGAWLGYLIDYSHLMAGCTLETGPLEGGILAFGPGNTPATGAVRPDLGADDVERLTTYYVAAFGDALGLDEDERGEVRAHLLLTAQADIDPAASEVLSTCGDSADAGL